MNARLRNKSNARKRRIKERLETVCHLVDEEREDFRKRIELKLNSPQSEWPSISPELWAIVRRHFERDLQKSIARFRNERLASVSWREVKAPAATYAIYHFRRKQSFGSR